MKLSWLRELKPVLRIASLDMEELDSTSSGLRCLLGTIVAQAMNDGMTRIEIGVVRDTGESWMKYFGPVHYDELPKTLIMTVVDTEDVDKVVSIIQDKAKTGFIGDGKIFISPVEAAYTVRTGEAIL